LSRPARENHVPGGLFLLFALNSPQNPPKQDLPPKDRLGKMETGIAARER
jgi:hypothetical protein